MGGKTARSHACLQLQKLCATVFVWGPCAQVLAAISALSTQNKIRLVIAFQSVRGTKLTLAEATIALYRSSSPAQKAWVHYGMANFSQNLVSSFIAHHDNWPALTSDLLDVEPWLQVLVYSSTLRARLWDSVFIDTGVPTPPPPPRRIYTTASSTQSYAPSLLCCQ